MFDIQQILELTLKRQKLPEDQLKELVFRVQALFVTEPNVVSVPVPTKICGDVHGQFYDVLKLFEVGSAPNPTRYVFLGDYVDRGYFSLEVITLLYCYKLISPTSIYLLRGNHESRAITQSYGFYDQCSRYYNHSAVWKAFVESFDFMPISAVVGQKIYCVHGGLSPSCQQIDDIRLINRAVEVPAEGPFTDCLWSDPDSKVPTFSASTRGAGYLFGPKAVEQFNHLNGVSVVARAHQLAPQGYQWWFANTCVTVWSCPNYFYKCKNLASIMCVDEQNNYKFDVFDAVPDSQREKPEWVK
ncbi:Serine/threonine-protein phosphatase [Spironucleus salmonicida]|uniref:Serine/threonine-protein phosphatase n=1 Tax=Spironucleus salmonicida TaxID=348837 RepID=V6LLY7_9EUKA|nr:Serine/threonine-protein phosphatase [Spironucleus salmonicida]|eukprot:EST45702.1 Serine/threonine-protein phosphatase [Spironucleus salmonicida]